MSRVITDDERAWEKSGGGGGRPVKNVDKPAAVHRRRERGALHLQSSFFSLIPGAHHIWRYKDNAAGPVAYYAITAHHAAAAVAFFLLLKRKKNDKPPRCVGKNIFLMDIR